MPLLTFTSADFPFQPFTKIYSADVNQCFNDIKTLLNVTGLDDSNIAAAGITRGTKLKTGTARAVVVNDSTGAMSEVAPGTAGTFLQSTGASSAPIWSSLGGSPADMQNVGITATVAANALTVNLTGSAGGTPSSSNIVNVAFRNSTLATGQYALVACQAATSIVVPSSATLGSQSGAANYIYVYAINNAGTLELALCGQNIQDQNLLVSTTAISSSATSNSVIYSTTSRSNVAIRYLGRIKSTQATAGTWATNPSEISVGSFIPASARSEVWVTGSQASTNNYGSTNTAIRRFNTATINVGTAITYADSVTLGASFTINEPGMYLVTRCETLGGSANWGISINSNQLTTEISSITFANFVAMAVTPVASLQMTISRAVYCAAGDVIRPHDDPAAQATTTNQQRVYMQVVKLS